jgi:ribonuclease HI
MEDHAGTPGQEAVEQCIVRNNEQATQASIVWSAATSLAKPITTKNQAEYRGILEGLREVQRQNWTPLDLVRDSQLILDNCGGTGFHATKRSANSTRRLGDQLGVRRWIHHLRAYNKMADAAANVAMGTKQSSHVHNPTTRAQHASLVHLLGPDFAQ